MLQGNFKRIYRVLLKERINDESFETNDKTRQPCRISGEETRFHTARRVKRGSNPTVYRSRHNLLDL